jgi:hypothetical protein
MWGAIGGAEGELQLGRHLKAGGRELFKSCQDVIAQRDYRGDDTRLNGLFLDDID